MAAPWRLPTLDGQACSDPANPRGGNLVLDDLAPRVPLAPTGTVTAVVSDLVCFA